eukprot:5643661-Pyramimonas_sp.AAC.1
MSPPVRVTKTSALRPWPASPPPEGFATLVRFIYTNTAFRGRLRLTASTPTPAGPLKTHGA